MLASLTGKVRPIPSGSMHLAYLDDSRDERLAIATALVIPADRWNEAFAAARAWRRRGGPGLRAGAEPAQPHAPAGHMETATGSCGMRARTQSTGSSPAACECGTQSRASATSGLSPRTYIPGLTRKWLPFLLYSSQTLKSMSVSWATAGGIISVLVVGVGGLLWRIKTDRIAERRANEAEKRARVPDVEVKIESFVNWASREQRGVRLAVANRGDFIVRVIEVGCREQERGAFLGVHSPLTWAMGEGQGKDLPKEIPPHDGHRFTIPMPARDPQATKRLPELALPEVMAWAKISTGEFFVSPPAVRPRNER